MNTNQLPCRISCIFPRRQPSLRLFGLAMLLALSSFRSASDAEERSAAAPHSTPWIEDAYFHAHHSTGVYAPEWRDEIAVIRPDVVQFHANSQDAAREMASSLGFRLWQDGTIKIALDTKHVPVHRILEIKSANENND